MTSRLRIALAASAAAVVSAALGLYLARRDCGTGQAGTVDCAHVCLRTGGPTDSEVEAAWTPAGATCIGERTRGPVGCMLPRCLGGEPAFWTTATP